MCLLDPTIAFPLSLRSACMVDGTCMIDTEGIVATL